jgi:formamidopyrimidine-DNA glycosylase
LAGDGREGIAVVPELPDIALYLSQLAPRILHQPLLRVTLKNPFVLRSVEPPLSAVEGKRILGLRRLGKRIVLELEGELFLVIHLMIAGRLKWQPLGSKLGSKIVLAVLEFPEGLLVLTEAGSKRRASIHLVAGEQGLQQFDRGGLEVMDASLEDFAARLTSANHTLKRALTDPRLFSGIGNAYSDEILHRARLSPLTLTSRLSQEEIGRLFQATRATLEDWIAR